MDKKIITDAFKQLLKRNLAKDIKAAQNSKAPKLTGNLAKLNKPGKIANVAIKMTETLVAMNAVDALAAKVHQLLPKTADGLEWLHALPSKIANSTIGQIPVLGTIYRWINNAIAEGFAKLSEFLGNDTLATEARKRKRVDPDEGFNASFEEGTHNLSGSRKNNNQEGEDDMKNDPKFYTNLDLHKTFMIPGAYTKTTVVNGTMATPKLAVHRLSENPIPDKSAFIDRLNQKFALMKAVRGLSATQYQVLDIANYERVAKIMLLQYYTLKKVISAAKTYSLVQVHIADNIIKAYGFVPSEVRANLANYETLLCQIHRFITNNLPMSGTWINRLEYLIGANIPDYSDQRIATIHMFTVSMRSAFYAAPKEDETFELVFDTIPNAGNNNYNVMLSNFVAIQDAVIGNVKWQQLIADYFGAFGEKAMWSDKAYPQYKEPLNLRNADNDLCREQVKNAFYMNGKVELITIDSGVANERTTIDFDNAQPVQLPTYQFGTSTFTNLVYGSRVALNYNNILDNDSYLLLQKATALPFTIGSTNKVLEPDMNGVGAAQIDVTDGVAYAEDQTAHETIYTLHKDSYSEGEALEISQFKVRCIGRLNYVHAPSDWNVSLLFKTHEYAVMDSTIYVYADVSGTITDTDYRICNEAISSDDLEDVESAIDFPEEIMAWSLIDWMPFTHYTFFGYDSVNSRYNPRDVLAIDIDGYGSLDDRAFATSINYSIYSLQACGLVIGKKRVDNLASVYKDKSSKAD